MATQTVLANGADAHHSEIQAASITVPLNFNLQAVDARLLNIPAENSVVEKLIGGLQSRVAATPTAPPKKAESEAERVARLGVLANFRGTFEGPGFNMIFRPKSNNPMDTTFPKPVNTHGSPDDNVLEMNLTRDEFTFTDTLGFIPNRGMGNQADINLTGVSYVQSVFDVTNPATGKGDNDKTPIHFEPGMFILTPATTDPVSGPIITRMASIPHGTTINLSGPAPDPNGAPIIPFVNPQSITPFFIGNPSQQFQFNSQQIPLNDTRRLPQDLTTFNNAGTITQQFLNDPNQILFNANSGKKIVKSISFKVSNTADNGGISNIPMLSATKPSDGGTNAKVASVEASFFVQTVEYQVDVKKNDVNPLVKPKNIPPTIETPTFRILNAGPIAADQTLTVTSTQIQYTQTVLLNFGPLSWPHVSVATLSPKDPVDFVLSAVGPPMMRTA